MRRILMLTAAVAALLAGAADADAFGRHCRGGRRGGGRFQGGCAGGAPAAAVGDCGASATLGGCADCAQAAPAAVLPAVAAPVPLPVPLPARGEPTGAKAVYVGGPAGLRQVGWLAADGSIVPLAATVTAPTIAAP